MIFDTYSYISCIYYIFEQHLMNFAQQQAETNERQAAVIQQLQEETGVSLNLIINQLFKFLEFGEKYTKEIEIGNICY